MGAQETAKITRILPETATITEAVQETAKALKIAPAHTAAVKLALEYAEAIDDAACPECGGHTTALDKLGPKLLAALEALGATPAGKSKANQPATGTKPESELERLRAARARRKN